MTRFLVFAVTLALAISAFADKGVNKMKINPRPKEPHTTFQTGGGYDPTRDIRTDAVIQYSCINDRMKSWMDKGYVVQTMYGFRTGDDYIKDHRDEVQTTADGTLHTCGPGSYYMVPTQTRIDAAVDYYRQAIKNGTSMAVPEEPEFFIQTGYSESFKKEWQAYYGEPWQDQTASIEARWKSSRLKAFLEYRMVESILKESKKLNPEVVRAVAAHSAVSYYNWGIIYPHYQTMKMPELQEMIGQVWTGTARTPCKYEGKSEERTFEYGFLEYSALYNLMRGTGKRVWFLMDPLEDNPDRSMDDYQMNYVRTLVGSLMFTDVDEYEVMPWPERIFGRVPDGFATVIMNVVTMLGDIHNQKESALDTGTQGIATFVADSMGWQRGEPNASNYDNFYGMTLPLIMKGIPVQVAQLERTPEPKYLDPYKVLVLSYDIMKPMDAAYNKAIAAWIREGGSLVLLGGKDAYNDLPEWWKKEGFASPHLHLLAALKCPAEDGTYSVGKGTVIVRSAPPSYYASSKKAAAEFRVLVAQACGKAGLQYKEQHYMTVRRGRYVAVRAFEEPVTLKGTYVNVLDHGLPVIKDPQVAAEDLGVFADVSAMLADKKPRLMLSSSRLESSSETAGETRLLLSGPLKTKSIARISTAGKRATSVTVQDPQGKALPFEQKLEQGTLAITHDGLPEGVAVDVKWK